MTYRKASKKLQDEVYPRFTEHSERGKKNRAKGVAFEREIVKKLRSLWPTVRREFGQAREGNEVPDIGNTPYWIECSKGSTLAIHAKLDQALEAMNTTPDERYRDTAVIVISRSVRGHIMVTTTLDGFLELARL